MQEKYQRNFKNKWSLEEQEQFERLAREIKNQGWKLISQKMNESFPNKKRSPKQCREHYINFTKVRSQGTNLLDWSRDQDDILFQSYLKYGSKWVQISKFLPGRSENTVKNHFYGSLRKLLRRVNKLKKQTSIKKGKMIQQNTLYKLLEAQVCNNESEGSQESKQLHKQKFIWNLKYKILRLCFNSSTEQNKDQILNIISQLDQYKSLTRFDNIKKIKTGQNIKRKRFPPLLFNEHQCIQPQNSTEVKSDRQQSSEQFKNSIKPTDLGVENQQIIEKQGLMNDYPSDFYNGYILMEKDLDLDVSQIFKIPYQPHLFQFEDWY